jgi:predicted amidophosphoribosyltransferase
MLVVEMKKAGICCFCQKPATKVINGLRFCPNCGDTILIEMIGKCIKAVEDADISIKIIPKDIKCKK